MKSFLLFEPNEQLQGQLDEHAADCHTRDGRTYLYQEAMDDMENNFKMIEARQIEYDKPILIIWNPMSGKRKDLKPAIRKSLDTAGIKYEFYETKGPYDSYEQARIFDIDSYSLLAAIGGDGTQHEIVNGMLKREDKKKIPICPIPNGSGNIWAFNFGINDLETALNAIKCGYAVKNDVVKSLSDVESEEQAVS